MFSTNHLKEEIIKMIIFHFFCFLFFIVILSVRTWLLKTHYKIRLFGDKKSHFCYYTTNSDNIQGLYFFQPSMGHKIKTNVNKKMFLLREFKYKVIFQHNHHED